MQRKYRIGRSRYTCHVAIAVIIAVGEVLVRGQAEPGTYLTPGDTMLARPHIGVPSARQWAVPSTVRRQWHPRRCLCVFSMAAHRMESYDGGDEPAPEDVGAKETFRMLEQVESSYQTLSRTECLHNAYTRM